MKLLFSKKSIIALMLIASMTCMCACGAEIPDLTDEQMSMIADYSSALLLKYDSGTPSRLLPEGSVDLTIEYHEPVVRTDTPSSQDTEEVATEYDMDDVTVNDTTDPGQSTHTAGFADFLEGTGVQVNYAGQVEIVDSYPTENSNVYFTVDASAGNKLLVIHFTMTNISSDEMSIQMRDLGLKYRVSLNGGKNKNVMTTMLSNDILSYTGSLAPNESTDIVAIAEISNDEVDISTLDFIIKGSEFSSSMKIQ